MKGKDSTTGGKNTAFISLRVSQNSLPRKLSKLAKPGRRTKKGEGVRQLVEARRRLREIHEAVKVPNTT